jgi:hypothetical protein
MTNAFMETVLNDSFAGENAGILVQVKISMRFIAHSASKKDRVQQ